MDYLALIGCTISKDQRCVKYIEDIPYRAEELERTLNFK